jgi:CheY-like chemotaxis protein
MTAAGFPTRVLVVEDELINRDILRSTLETAGGFEVRSSDDGFGALVILRGLLPEVLITDLEMPRMSGFELLSIVRRRFPQIGVVAVSGSFHAADHSRVLVDAFVSKPFRTEELLDALATVRNAASDRSERKRSENAPIWVPREEKGYYVITCTDCLRSFSIVPDLHSIARESVVECIHCGVKLRYMLANKDHHA